MSALESEGTGGVRLVRRRIGEDGCLLLERLDGVFSTSTLLIETFEAWRRMTFRSSPFGLLAFLPCMIVYSPENDRSPFAVFDIPESHSFCCLSAFGPKPSDNKIPPLALISVVDQRHSRSPPSVFPSRASVTFADRERSITCVTNV
jgi:hypothetical protein